ncbi:hypothetical protein LSH36_82g06017 [Paralvinella palmiformis]|uniref:Uncharacterized protein n=1 Tax=Paralvinella palmiformis TaxID=53620 RepID=A0AAD9K217_9ANNE|nr:hypothetical protein LSH36_82g06017 [Paralvinella palmiformis]
MVDVVVVIVVGNIINGVTIATTTTATTTTTTAAAAAAAATAAAAAAAITTASIYTNIRRCIYIILKVNENHVFSRQVPKMMLKLSVGGCTVLALFLAFSLVSAQRANSGDDLDLNQINNDEDNDINNNNNMIARRSLQMARGFGSSSGRSPFTSLQNGDLVDWRDIFSSSSAKRSMSRPGGSFGDQSGFDRGQLQNWIDYFSRGTRAFGPSTKPRSKALGSFGGFGVDGLQNWRAFFDDQRQRQRGFGR